MRVLYVGSHSILEYDEVRLLASLGHDVFSIGSYTDPANPSDDKRPPIPGMTYHPELAELCLQQREKHAGEDLRYFIDYAKADLHPDLLDWSDAVIFAAFPDAWIVPQWERLKQKRTVWRTIGQSDPTIERWMAPLHAQGLEIVRYSPAEKRAFEKLNSFAGEDTMIRFVKDPADWYGWTGEDRVIGNITQDMAGRGEACGYTFWMRTTEGLATRPAGPNSQALPGGIGTLSYDAMRAYLRRIRAYLFTGTQPASYTLGLIEAMMTGVPIVSITAAAVGYPPLFEADEFVPSGDVIEARTFLRLALDAAPETLRDRSQSVRERAIELFGTETIGAQWNAYLGSNVAVAA